MKGKTHIAGGLALGYLAFNNIDMLNVNLASEKVFLITTVGLTLGSLLPDIDHHNSIISNRVKPIGFITSKIFRHRGFTHSIIGIFVLTSLMVLILKYFNVNNFYLATYMKGFCIGMLSHVLLDLLTPSGVNLLYPYKKRYNIAKFKMGGVKELVLVFIFIGLIFLNNSIF